jgi:hypothetical protein
MVSDETLEYLKRKVNRLQNEIVKNKAEIRKLKGENRRLLSKKSSRKSASLALSKFFSPSQTKSILSERRVKWSEEDIVNGLMIRSVSKKCYQLIRRKNMLPLPCLSTLQSWVAKLDCSPGILNSVLAMLKEQMSSDDNPLTKLGVLVFDEMKLMRKYEYYKKNDCIFGASKKVQVAMIQGLCHDWKQPIFFHFDTPMTENLLKELLLRIEETGIEVWAVTCDGGPAKQALTRKLGITPENTSFPNPADPSRPIFVFQDVPHLIKLIRNHVLDEGIFVDGTQAKLAKEDFVQLLKTDCGESRILHKLNEAHIQCTGPQRKQVRLAAQLLSHSTAVAMKALQPGKEEQSKFVDLVNSWFDVHNSRLKFSKNKLSCGFGIHLEEQASTLHKMNAAAKSFRCDTKLGTAPFERGILISNNSLLSLFEQLKERRGVQFILTSHLNQDCLENLFSRIRSMGGSYTHPTTFEFIHRIRNLIIGRATDLAIKTESVEMEDDSSTVSAPVGYISSELISSVDANDSC